jgi:membrane protein implicated in regulation of membrane protease activity
MLASLIKLGVNLITLDLRRSLRALTVTAVLMLIALAILLVAAGFGLSLLSVWLRQALGTMPALAIITGGCALAGLSLLAIAFLRPGRRRAAPPPQSERSASTERMIDEAIAAMQQGSRESMLVAVVLAVVTGVILGRKL